MRDEQGREYTKVTRGKTNPNAQPDAHGYIAMAVADLAKQGRGSADPVVQALCHADHILVHGVPAPTMEALPSGPIHPGPFLPGVVRDDVMMVDALFQVLPSDEVEVEKAAWERLRPILSRPDIHTEARKWGYIPGSGGLRNPATGERLDP